jgi:resolvase-like protein
MTETLIGYARYSTDAQDLTAQRDRLRELGVAEDRIYLDHGLTGTTRNRPGLDQARSLRSSTRPNTSAPGPRQPRRHSQSTS